MRTSASCPFIKAHWSFSLVNRAAVAFVWLVLPICAVHFRDEKCCCGCSAEGEPGQWQWDNGWDVWWLLERGTGWLGHKHGGLWGKVVAEQLVNEQQWDFRAFCGYCPHLPFSQPWAGQGRLEDGWQDVLVLMRNKHPQQWPGGRKDVATDLRFHSGFLAHSVTSYFQ